MMAINDRPAAQKQMRSLTARFFQAFIFSKAIRFGGKKPVASLTYTLPVSAPTDAISPARAKPAVATCMLALYINNMADDFSCDFLAAT